MGRLEGQVAFVTGAARGTGRTTAVRLAQEGAAVIAVDLCAPIDTVPYPLADEEDLAATVREVEEAGGRIVASVADVRDPAALRSALEQGIERFGRLDIVFANAGTVGFGLAWEYEDDAWRDIVDVNLTGAWNTAKVAIPHLVEGGRGGSLVFNSSKEGLKGLATMGAYTAAKHGVVGLMRTLALELGEHRIRVNAVCATVVDTPMVQNESAYRLFLPGVEHPTKEDAAGAFQGINALPIPWVDSIDVANSVVFLASDEGRFLTGVALPVDAGALYK